MICDVYDFKFFAAVKINIVVFCLWELVGGTIFSRKHTVVFQEH